MKKHSIAPPVVITVILALFLLLYFAMVLFVPLPLPFKIVTGIILFAFLGVAVFVLVERIKEIRSGEEDDLSKY